MPPEAPLVKPIPNMICVFAGIRCYTARCFRAIGSSVVFCTLAAVLPGCSTADPSSNGTQAENVDEQSYSIPAAANTDTDTSKTLGVGKRANPVPDEHQSMLQILEQIGDYMQKTSPVVGDAPLAALQQQMIQSRRQGNLRGVFDAEIRIGRHHTAMGDGDLGIEFIVRAMERLPEIRNEHPDFCDPREEALLYVIAALAAIRKAENENCLCCLDGQSCLFPISDQGVHAEKAGSKRAVKFLNRCLQLDPTNMRAVWLLNIAAMTLGEYPAQVPKKFRLPASRLKSVESFPRFPNVAAQLKVDTLSLAGGAIADDFDGDGMVDIVCSNWNPKGQLEFFRNQGDGTFERQTEQANLIGITGGLNVNHADYDNDGDLDLFVMRGGWLGRAGSFPNSLLQNSGAGVFRDVTFEVGLGAPYAPTQTSAWADYDNDGDLDLYVGNEALPNQLFENHGGKFRDRAAIAGVADASMTKGVAWGDANGDDLPDLYVSNLGKPNRLFINIGKGRFVDRAEDAGVVEPAEGFPTWFWDFNNDGNLDLYASRFQQGVEHVATDYLQIGKTQSVDAHYQGNGKGGFTDVTESLGLSVTTQPMGCNFGDLNNDGYLDFYLGTGYPAVEGIMPNLMYLNKQGDSFIDVSAAGGFGHLQKGHGIAFADFDNDGDQDVLAQLGGWFLGDNFQNSFFRNPGFDANWIKIRLVGKQSNRFGVGARIRLEVTDDDKVRSIYRTVGYGSSFGGNPYRQEIGVSKAKTINLIEVHWPRTGKTQRFEDVDVNQSITIDESKNVIAKAIAN